MDSILIRNFNIKWVSGVIPTCWYDYQGIALRKAALYSYTIQLIKKEDDLPLFVGGSDLFTVELSSSGIILSPVFLIEGGVTSEP